jgi:ribosomal protein L35AE/L33A
MTESVQGVIVNYRTGPKSQKSKEYLIQFTCARSVSDAARLVGRKVAWQKGEDKIVGKIVSLHGKKGLVRARIRKGLPGQAIGTAVNLMG